MASNNNIPAQYWDPLNNSSEITLSNLNKTATRSTTNNSNWRCVRGVTSHSSGKWYAECVNDASGTVNGSMIFGVCKAAASLSVQPGGDANSWGEQPNNPSVFFYLAGTPQNESSSHTTIGAGGYGKIAVDFNAGKGWFGTSTSSSGGWGGTSTDPTTGLSNHFSFTPGTPLYLILGMYSSPQQCTLRTAAADFAGTPPSGFGAWG